MTSKRGRGKEVDNLVPKFDDCPDVKDGWKADKSWNLAGPDDKILSRFNSVNNIPREFQVAKTQKLKWRSFEWNKKRGFVNKIDILMNSSSFKSEENFSEMLTIHKNYYNKYL
jgi:hypothetical protein